MYIRSWYTVCIVLGLFLLSCKKEVEDPPSIEEDGRYFPLQTRCYSIYEVESITYSFLQGNKIKNYFLKERIADSSLDLAGSIAYRMERYISSKKDGPWTIDSVWIARRDGRQCIKIENNVALVKLMLPLIENFTWNGDQRNIAREEDANQFSKLFRMVRVGRPLMVNGQVFDYTVTVVQRKDSSLVSKDFRTEIYAKDVGLVYRQKVITFNVQEGGQIVFPLTIDHGISYTEKIVNYGKE